MTSGSAPHSIAAALNQDSGVDNDVIRAIGREGNAVRVVYEPPTASAWAVTKRLLGAAAAAYEPEFAFETPAVVIGELHGIGDDGAGREWRAEAEWFRRYLDGEWSSTQLLTAVFEASDDFTLPA